MSPSDSPTHTFVYESTGWATTTSTVFRERDKGQRRRPILADQRFSKGQLAFNDSRLAGSEARSGPLPPAPRFTLGSFVGEGTSAGGATFTSSAGRASFPCGGERSGGASGTVVGVSRAQGALTEDASGGTVSVTLTGGPDGAPLDAGGCRAPSTSASAASAKTAPSRLTATGLKDPRGGPFALLAAAAPLVGAAVDGAATPSVDGAGPDGAAAAPLACAGAVAASFVAAGATPASLDGAAPLAAPGGAAIKMGYHAFVTSATSDRTLSQAPYRDALLVEIMR
jgi:hypothetical protein